MKKYLELFANGFDATIAEKTKVENWPYVGYDPMQDSVRYTEIEKPMIGPADNEIWYTSKNENVVNPYTISAFGANIVSNTYENGKGVLKFDNSVTKIGGYAFYRCSGLTSITIPNSVKSIGYYAFQYCSFTSITIPNSVTSIGYEAFEDCRSLTSITIPNSVTRIGIGAFSGCSSLTSMFVEEGNTVYNSHDNCNAIIETATNTLVAGCQNTIILNSVTSIGEWAFTGSSLTSITIPNSVTSIGDYAFSSCTSLASIVISDSVTSIGKKTFYGCYPLTSIVIPDGVTSIGEEAFAWCKSLAFITIPNSVTSIGWGAFNGCSKLTSVTFEGTMEEWNIVSKGGAWNSDVPATYVQCSDGQVAL